jgi:hypothetical protein
METVKTSETLTGLIAQEGYYFRDVKPCSLAHVYQSKHQPALPFDLEYSFYYIYYLTANGF